MHGELILPVLDEAFLHDDDDGIDDVLAQPVKHQIHADFGFSKPLLMEDGGVG
jgi:hypothetical protein